MRLTAIMTSVWLAILAMTPAVQAEKPTRADLEEAIAAYHDSKALLHKADSFLHARRAYFIGQQLFADKPGDLAPIAHAFALAAARYKEPVALQQYQSTLDLLIEAHGPDSGTQIPVLVDAGEEALHRKEPEMAYAFLKQAGELLARDVPDGSFEEARVHLGLARLYLNSGEYGRAEERAATALAVAEKHQKGITYPVNAAFHFWHAQVMRGLGKHTLAETSYLHALSLYRESEPRARPILSIHRRMIEVSHNLGKLDAAVHHCLEAEKYENQRNMGHWHPIYDPNGRLSQFDKPKTGQILAGFTRTEDCRAINVVIHRTHGISVEEAKRLIEHAYFTPELRNGKLAENQRVDQMNINVY